MIGMTDRCPHGRRQCSGMTMRYGKAEITVMGASRPTVDKWLAHDERFDLEGLVSMPSRTRFRKDSHVNQDDTSVGAGDLALVLDGDARYIWKTEGVYVSQTWVSRLWRENGLKP